MAESRSTEQISRSEPIIDLREKPRASFELDTDIRIELHHPLESPTLWQAYLDGAEKQYRAHGVLSALNIQALASGRTTSLFFLAIDREERVVGGIRCHGPLRSVSEAYAKAELAAHPRFDTIQKLLGEAVPKGVVEIKGAWTDQTLAPRGVSDALARCHVYAMEHLGASHAMCTSSDTIARRWSTTGGRAFADLDPVSYPDDRYRTVLLWWSADTVESLSTDTQAAAMATERQALGLTSSQTVTPSPPEAATWAAEILDERVTADAARLLALRSEGNIEFLDHFDEQLDALRAMLPVTPTTADDEAPRWAFYPWRRTAVRVLGPQSFRRLRLDRNRNKITSEEQDKLGQLCIGVVGLSVGHAIAHVLALEGICGRLRLADFDHLELSNLNRIPATVLDLGLNKAIVVARRVAELDPYITVDVEQDGLTADNLDEFMGSLDMVVEECDSLDMKAMVRDGARRARIPVLMETSDRGLLDIERFDLEPDRPIFHGLLGDVEPSELVGLSTHEKVPHVLRILEPDQLSSRMAASMAEIDETVSTWPQLGGDVMLGGATIASAVRAIGRGETVPSGRGRIDLTDVVKSVTTPEPAPQPIEVLSKQLVVPDDPRLAVAHAAHLAPSGGNVQPWTLEVDDQHLRIRVEPSATTAMDVQFRGSLVAAGAALFNARVAAASLGILGEARITPDPTNPGLALADLEFGQGNPQQPLNAELGALYPLVLARTTNRRRGTRLPIVADDLTALRDAVESEGAKLDLVTDSEAIVQYAELLSESDRLRYLTPHLHREMMSELRWPELESVETGIDVRTLELDHSDLGKLAVARRVDVMADLARWNGGRALGEVTRERVGASSAIAAVTIADADPASYVRGGAALERLWLASEAAGLAVQPVSPVSVFALNDEDLAGLVADKHIAELRSLTTGLRAVLGLREGRNIVLVVRLSHAEPPTVRSERQPLSAVRV